MSNQEDNCECRCNCGPACINLDIPVPAVSIPFCKDPNFEPIPESIPPSAHASFFNECCSMFVDEENDPIIITIDGISEMPRGVCTT